MAQFEKKCLVGPEFCYLDLELLDLKSLNLLNPEFGPQNNAMNKLTQFTPDRVELRKNKYLVIK